MNSNCRPGVTIKQDLLNNQNPKGLAQAEACTINILLRLFKESLYNFYIKSKLHDLIQGFQLNLILL